MTAPNHFQKCKEHKPPPTVAWGIAANQKWCLQCKRMIPLRIDWRGHP